MNSTAPTINQDDDRVPIETIKNWVKRLSETRQHHRGLTDVFDMIVNTQKVPVAGVREVDGTTVAKSIYLKVYDKNGNCSHVPISVDNPLLQAILRDQSDTFERQIEALVMQLHEHGIETQGAD